LHKQKDVDVTNRARMIFFKKINFEVWPIKITINHDEKIITTSCMRGNENISLWHRLLPCADRVRSHPCELQLTSELYH
jgi:hypothetical protein